MDTLADTLWQEFAVETEEHLQAIEPILARPDPQQVDAEDIAQLFRSFHSIKGLARAMDVLGMEAVAHHSESLLGLVRDGRAPLTADMADLLLEVVDALKRQRDIVAEQRHDVPADADLIARLGAAFTEAGGAPEPDAVAPPPAAVAPSGMPLHEDPEMLAIFVELVQTLGPELCTALASEAVRRQPAAEAAEALAHAAEVMNFDALAAGFGGLRSVLQLLAFGDELDEVARQDLVTRLGEIRLQIELLGELTGHDFGMAAFSAALAQRIGDDRDRLAVALSGLNRSLRDSLADGDRLAAEADAAAIARAARALQVVLAGLSQPRAAEIALLIGDLYARIASGEIEQADAIIEAADRTIALIGSGECDSGGDLAEEEAAQLAARLRAPIASAAQRALEAGAPLVAGLQIPAELLAILSDDNLAKLERGIGQHQLRPYEILVYLESDHDTAARWTRWLEAEARPITNRTVLADDESWFEFLVLSRLEPAALLDALWAIDPAHRCIKRVRLLTATTGGELIYDGALAEPRPGNADLPATIAVSHAPPQSTIRVRGELIEALLDDIGEFRVAAATLRHLIRGMGSREIMARSRALAARLSPELRNEFLTLVQDARERDRRLRETEELSQAC